MQKLLHWWSQHRRLLFAEGAKDVEICSLMLPLVLLVGFFLSSVFFPLHFFVVIVSVSALVLGLALPILKHLPG